MSYINYYTKTVTLSTLGAYTGYSSQDFSGFMRQFRITTNTAFGAAAKLTITTTSTENVLLVIVDPTSAGATWNPRGKSHGTTANVMGSSHPTPLPLFNDRMKFKVASSSGKAGKTITIKAYVG